MDDELGLCSAHSRLFFIGLLIHSSKDGFISLSREILKKEIYPHYQDINVSDLLLELEKSNLIFSINNGYQITNIHKWCVESKAIDTSYYASNRRALKRQAVPSWVDKPAIKAIYLLAKKKSTGCAKYHVDHIIPLKHHLVCGLHIESNLQVISQKDNLQKSNLFDGESYA